MFHSLCLVERRYVFYTMCFRNILIKHCELCKEQCSFEEPQFYRKLVWQKRLQHIPTMVVLLRPRPQMCEVELLSSLLPHLFFLWTSPFLLTSGSLVSKSASLRAVVSAVPSYLSSSSVSLLEHLACLLWNTIVLCSITGIIVERKAAWNKVRGPKF